MIMQKLKIIIFGFVEKLLCGNSPKGAQKYIYNTDVVGNMSRVIRRGALFARRP